MPSCLVLKEPYDITNTKCCIHRCYFKYDIVLIMESESDILILHLHNIRTYILFACVIYLNRNMVMMMVVVVMMLVVVMMMEVVVAVVLMIMNMTTTTLTYWYKTHVITLTLLPLFHRNPSSSDNPLPGIFKQHFQGNICYNPDIV